MTKPQVFPTPIQQIAVNLAFAVMGERRRIHRTYQEFMDIAARLPPLKTLLHEVNRLLEQFHKCCAECGRSWPQICRYKAGDVRIAYEPYPKKISYETLRRGLTVMGMRKPRRKKS